MLESFGLKPIKKEKNEDYKKPNYEPFKVIYSAFQKNYNPTDEEIEKIPEFLFHNVLSNKKELLDIAVFFTTHNIPMKAQYKFIRALPKMYIPYPKKSKKDEEIEIIKKYYKCSNDVAKIYYKMLNREQIINIIKKMKNVKELT